MVWIEGGSFLMGSDEFYPEERAVHEVAVDGFWIDERQVTVAEWRRFIKATGHVTMAERPLDPADYPDADPALLVRLARLPPDPWAGSPRQLHELVVVHPRREALAIPRDQAARSTVAIATRSPTWPGRMSRLMPPRQARTCRPRRNGSTPRGADSRARSSRGGTSSRRGAG